MKKIYECPVMMTEVYETNAYCSACGTSFKTGNLTTDSAHANKTNNGGGNWEPAAGFTREDLSHTFVNSKIFQISDGSCGMFGRGCDNKSQSIWKCICTDHPGETWYLEWSHYYSVHVNNNKDTFFLYREENNNDHFDIISSGDRWPAKTNGSDYNVAQVVYAEEEGVVVNS